MTATPGYTADILNAFYIVLALAVSVFAHKLFRTRPWGIIGDVTVAALGIVVFAFYLREGWMRLLIELNDDYPSYFASAYMPIVALVATGFMRSMTQLFPGGSVQPAGVSPLKPQATFPMPPAMPMPPAASMSNALPASVSSETVSSAPTGPVEIAAGPPGQKPPSTVMKVLQKGVGVVLLLIVALVLLGKFVTRNDLPGCQARATTDVLSDLFKSRNVDVKRYEGFTTRSTDTDLIACTAALTMMDNSAKDLDYEISRQQTGFQVKMDALRDR